MSARAVLVVLALLSGCDAPTSDRGQSYPLVFRSLDEDGEPLPGVQVLAGGERLGTTGADSALSVRLTGREGMAVDFDLRCPAGTRPHGDKASLRLRTLEGPPPEIELVCGRDKRMAALIVSAPGFADLPVLLHDREVARTDASGTAHFLVEGEPHMPMRVVLDTGSRPRLVPAFPHKDFQIGARDEIVVFTPALVEAPLLEKKKVVKKAKAPPPPPIYRPEKL
jgi:hypothetical protein